MPKFGTHPYINDIAPGYYIKTDSSDRKKCAVLCPYRPLRSLDDEPEIVVLEVDKDGKFVEGATPKSVKGEHLIEIGGGTNSLCAKVVQWHKENMGQYFNDIEVDSGSSDGQVDSAHAMEKMLGILEFDKLKDNFQTCNRKLADVFAGDNGNFLGVRMGRIEWVKIIKESTDPKEPHETEKQQTAVYAEVTAYDKWFNPPLLKSAEIIETISEFAAKTKPGDMDVSSTSDVIELLTQHEEAILKHIYDEVIWTNAKQANAYQFLDDPYHKLDDAREIRKPVHVPHMFSYTFLGLVTETTATEKEQEVYHTERAVWTSKRAGGKLQKRHKQFIENREPGEAALARRRNLRTRQGEDD